MWEKQGCNFTIEVKCWWDQIAFKAQPAHSLCSWVHWEDIRFYRRKRLLQLASSLDTSSIPAKTLESAEGCNPARHAAAPFSFPPSHCVGASLLGLTFSIFSHKKLSAHSVSLCIGQTSAVRALLGVQEPGAPCRCKRHVAVSARACLRKRCTPTLTHWHINIILVGMPRRHVIRLWWRRFA